MFQNGFERGFASFVQLMYQFELTKCVHKKLN